MSTSSKGPGKAGLADWAKALPFYLLPHHAVSRAVNAATRVQAKWWKDPLTRWFMQRFAIDLSEAELEDPEAFRHFNEFFTRALKPGVRPLPDDPQALACPADGAISAFGEIRGDSILQAKRHDYSLTTLLGGEAARAQPFLGGTFATIYLSPRDYHRVHMPAEGTLREMIHVPGRLFSVAPFTVRTVPQVFARNERVVCLFDSPRGPFALILVGAINVASIETVWAGVVTPPRGRRIQDWRYQGEQARHFQRGEEMGRFNMGSTVIALFGPGQMNWAEGLEVDAPVRLGQPLGRYL